MRNVNFLGREYSAETFELDVDVFSLSDDELEEFEYLIPRRKYVFTGKVTHNGDDEYFKSKTSYIVDERYLEEIDLEILESKKFAI